ncbi:Plasmodium exported protein (hyp1), unknown function [Plasmodium sp. DRC-Itaito]|nr:Plasmodium exported protein (hyp1), unknown function [Plasmodium sp. DRC-Itaito]
MMINKNYNISKNGIRQIGIRANRTICFTSKHINIIGKCQKKYIKHFLIFNKVLLLFILVCICQYSIDEITFNGSRSTKQDEEKASLRFNRLLAQSFVFNSRLDGSYNYSNVENERMYMPHYMNNNFFKSQAYNESEKRDHLRSKIYNEQNDFPKEGYSREYDSKYNSQEFGTSRKKNNGRNSFNYQSNNENNKHSFYMNEDMYNKNYFDERENIDELNKKMHDDWSNFLIEDYSHEFESNIFNSPHYDTYKSQYDTYKSQYGIYNSEYDTYNSEYDDRNNYFYPSSEENFVPPFMDENMNGLNNSYRTGFDESQKNNINDDEGINFVRDEFYDEYNNNMNTPPQYMFSPEWDNQNTYDGFESGWNNYNSEYKDFVDQVNVETPYIRVVEEINDESDNIRDDYDMLNNDSPCNRNEKMEYYFQSDKFPVNCKGIYTNSNIVVEEYDIPIDIKDPNNNVYSYNDRLNNERQKKHMQQDKEFVNEKFKNDIGYTPSSNSSFPHSQPMFTPETFQTSNIESPEFQTPTFESPEFQTPTFESPEFQIPTFESPPVNTSDYEIPHFNLSEYDLPHLDPSEFKPEPFDESEFDPPVFDPSEYKNSTFKQPKYSTSSHSSRFYENEFNLSTHRRNCESSSRIHVDDENYMRLKNILSSLCSSREKIYDLSKEEKEFLVKMLKLDYEDFNFNSRQNPRIYNESSSFTNFELKRIHSKIKAFIYKCLLRLLQSYEKSSESHGYANIYDIY